MEGIISQGQSLGLKIELLPFESGKDEELISDLEKRNPGVDIYLDKTLKFLHSKIATAKLVFSSRYHGLLSALKLEVPVLGTSWSFKYERLFESYDIKDYLIDNLNNLKNIKKLVKQLNEPEQQKKIREKISNKNNEYKQNTNNMWQDIWDLLNK